MSIDVFLKVPTDFVPAVESIKEKLEAAYDAASKANKMASKRQATNYDRKIRGNALLQGDMVLVRNVGLKGKQKLADRWQQDRYVVLDQPNPEIPVYKVCIEGEKKYKMLHRNMLLPLYLPREVLGNVPFSDSKSVPSKGSKNVPFKGSGSVPSQDSVPFSQDHNVSSSSSEDFDLFQNVVLQLSMSGSELSDHDFDVEQEVEDCINIPISIPHLEASAIKNVSQVDHDTPVEEALGQAQSLPELSPVVPDREIGAVDLAEEVECPEIGSDVEEQELRRSGRSRKRPDYLNDYVSHSQRVSYDGWRDRVTVLISLLQVFPTSQELICNAIVHVISNCS